MLEVIGAGTGNTGIKPDYAKAYISSPLCRMNKERLRYEFLAPERANDPLFDSPIESPTLIQNGRRSESFNMQDLSQLQTPMRKVIWLENRKLDTQNITNLESPEARRIYKQILYLVIRNMKTYWRTPEFTLSRLVVILVIGTLITTTYWQQSYESAADIQSRINAIMFMMMLTAAYNLFTIMPFQIEKRALIYREISSGMYWITASVLSDGIVEIPYLIAETLVGVNIVYWGVGFQDSDTAYFYYTITFFIYLYFMTALGMFLAILLPDALSAQLVATVVIQIFQLFAGVIVPLDKLPYYYKPMYWVSAQHYAGEAIITTQFHHDNTRICNPSGVVIDNPPWWAFAVKGKFCSEDGRFNGFKKFTGIVETAEEFIYNSDTAFLHGYKFENKDFDLFVLLCLCLVLRLFTGVAAMFINYNKR